MVALHLGHDVVAFEPFQSNVDLICSSILQHASATEKSKFHLNQLGLDFKPRQCELFQQKHVNIGDTHSVCDEKTRAHFLGSGYASLGWMNTTTLDDALVAGAFAGIDRIDIMKIDVEGFEPSVILGGNRFFESKYAPRYVFMEMVSSLMDSAFGAKTRGKDYLRTTGTSWIRLAIAAAIGKAFRYRRARSTSFKASPTAKMCCSFARTLPKTHRPL
jgi:FkbM family methyltransferase